MVYEVQRNILLHPRERIISGSAFGLFSHQLLQPAMPLVRYALYQLAARRQRYLGRGCSGYYPGLRGNTIQPTNLPNSITQTAETTFDAQRLMSLEQMETEYIKWVLGQVDGKRKSAAEILRIDPKTLYRKLKPS